MACIGATDMTPRCSACRDCSDERSRHLLDRKLEIEASRGNAVERNDLVVDAVIRLRKRRAELAVTGVDMVVFDRVVGRALN